MNRVHFQIDISICSYGQDMASFFIHTSIIVTSHLHVGSNRCSFSKAQSFHQSSHLTMSPCHLHHRTPDSGACSTAPFSPNRTDSPSSSTVYTMSSLYVPYSIDQAVQTHPNKARRQHYRPDHSTPQAPETAIWLCQHLTILR